MSVMINGKEVSTEDALDLLQKDSTVITEASFELKNENRKNVPLSNEGFPIEKDLISSMSREMSEMGADLIKMTLTDSPYIMGRTLTITIEDPKPEPGWLKSQAIKVGKWLIR